MQTTLPKEAWPVELCTRLHLWGISLYVAFTPLYSSTLSGSVSWMGRVVLFTNLTASFAD